MPEFRSKGTRKRKGKAVLFIMAAVIIIGIVGYIAGSPRATGNSSSSGLRGILPSPGRMTKEEWLKKLDENGLNAKIMNRFNGIGCPESEFIEIMGNPDRTQAVGDHIYWYFRCSDGQIQMVIYKGNLEHYGQVLVDTINHY